MSEYRCARCGSTARRYSRKRGHRCATCEHYEGDSWTRDRMETSADGTELGRLFRAADVLEEIMGTSVRWLGSFQAAVARARAKMGAFVSVARPEGARPDSPSGAIALVVDSGDPGSCGNSHGPEGADPKRKAEPGEDSYAVSRIEVEFAMPVYLEPGDVETFLDAIVRRDVNQFEEHLHWLAGTGSKPIWSQTDARLMGKPVDPEAPVSGEPTFDDDIFHAETAFRERYEGE